MATITCDVCDAVALRGGGNSVIDWCVDCDNHAKGISKVDEYQHLRESADADEFVVTRTGVVETSDDGLTAEASDLGLAPGQWPARIRLGDRLFVKVLTDGYTGRVLYRQDKPGPVVHLTVWND